MTLPAGWERSTLGDLCDKPQYGWTTKARSNGEGLRLLRTTDISRGKVDWSSVPFCEAEPDDALKYLVRSGDILISRAGSIGYSYLVVDPEPAVFASYLIRFRPRVQSVDPRYISWFLKSPAYWAQVREKASGMTLANINAKKLQSVQIPIAPSQTQVRIVQEIEKQFTRLDAAVGALRRVGPNVRRYRKAILSAAFTGRLIPTEAELASAEGRPLESGDELVERILAMRRALWERSRAKGRKRLKYEEPPRKLGGILGELPAGWTWVSWREVGLCQNGKAFPSREYSPSGVKLIRPGNLHVSGQVSWTDANTRRLPERYEQEFPELLVGPNELVMNLTAQSLKDEFLGRVCLTGTTEHCLLNQRLAKLTPVIISPRFMFWLFKSNLFRRFVDGLNKGSLIQHMFTSQRDEFVFPLPPLAEQERIVFEIELRLSVIEEVETILGTCFARAERARGATLQRAFSGQLVKDARGARQNA